MKSLSGWPPKAPTSWVAARSAVQIDETAGLVEAAGGRATALTVDVSDAGAVQQMIAEVEHDAGPVDLLVK
jgi:NAD(P)-dependent dehydrogenase (short-subunit alcohol dehydrogenase family)